MHSVALPETTMENQKHLSAMIRAEGDDWILDTTPLDTGGIVLDWGNPVYSAGVHIKEESKEGNGPTSSPRIYTW